MWALMLWWDDDCGWSGRCGWPLVWLVACLVWRLPAGGLQGWVEAVVCGTRGGAPGASAGSLVGRAGLWGWRGGGGGAGLRFLILMSACWWVGLLSHTTGCGFWSVPQLVLAHW